MNKEFSASNNVLDYFLYGGTVWVLNLVLSNCCKSAGIDYSENTRITMAIVLAVVAGVLWPAYLKQICLDIANWINRKLGRNQIFTEENILEKEFADGKDHYIAIFRNNQKIAEGWLKNKTAPENAFSLIVDEEWKTWFEQNTHREIVVIYLDKDTYIKEYSEI